jgi:hypothetical protein
MTTAEIRCKLKSSPLFRSKLQECIRVEKLLLSAVDSNQKLTNCGQTGNNFYRQKSIRSASTARAATLSMKAQNSGYFSKIDITHFINTYFSERTPVPYSRLSIHCKLLVCQWTLHSQPDTTAEAQPFVFRLSPELNAMSDSQLRQAIRRKLKDTFGIIPLYWLTTEYDNHQEQYGKHLNGEISLYPGQLEICKQAFKELFGLHWIDPDTKKPRMNADGTIRQKKGLRFAIDFPIASRRNQARLYGEFYSVFNWVSYGTKQFTRRWFSRKYTKESVKGNESFYYISADLNKQGAEFYNKNIKK